MLEKFCNDFKLLIKNIREINQIKISIWFISKLKIEIYGNELKNFKKGDILIINFGYNIGTELNKERMGLVISPNFISRFSKDLIVVPISSKKESKNYNDKKDLYYFIKKKDYKFLINDSYILFDKIRNISKKRIIKKVGKIYVDEYNIILNNMLNLYKK